MDKEQEKKLYDFINDFMKENEIKDLKIIATKTKEQTLILDTNYENN
jgi:hypothetical protein